MRRTARLVPVVNIRQRYVDTGLELEYILRDTDIDETSVRAVLGSDLEYMRKRGIID